MDLATHENIDVSISTRIERDMKIYPVAQINDKLTAKDYLERIAKTQPLLGRAIISERNFKIIERYALEAIRLSLDNSDIKDIGHLATLLAIIQYAKNWERTESSGFWAYICEQLGYKYSEALYSILTTSVKKACDCYRRLFIIDSSGANSYYSTVLAHAIAPNKSFFALCDFLEKFYKNNLDCSVHLGDPAIEHMVEVLQDRCQGATIEQDEEIRGNVGGIQTGFKSLLLQRPVYMRFFLTTMLQSIDTMLTGGELGNKDYIDLLLTQWYMSKLTEPSRKRSAPKHKRTTEIAFSYGKIRLSFILNEDNEPALRIPSIRLSTPENPVVIIHTRETVVFRQPIGVYGNDYATTSEELIIPLSDFDFIDDSNIQIELIIGNKQVFISDKNFWTGTLLFRDGIAISSKIVDEGNYVLFAIESSEVKFDGSIERRRRSYFAQLYDLFIQGESSIYVNNVLVCCSRPTTGLLRLRLPRSISDYVIDGISYQIFPRTELTILAVGVIQNTSFIAETSAGLSLHVTVGVDDIHKIELPETNGQHTIRLIDCDKNRVLDEINLFIVNQFSMKFDQPYYFENSEEGKVILSIDDEQYQIPLSGHREKVMVPYGDGEILVQIPRIVLMLDGQAFPKNYIWKGVISPASRLRIICPDNVNISISLDGVSIARTDVLNGYEYAIGNAIQAYDGDAAKLSVDLFIASNNYHMFYVVNKPCLMAEPQFDLNGNTLTWLNSHSFYGYKEARLQFDFIPKNGAVIKATITQGERVIFMDFPDRSEHYNFVVSAVTETTFGENKTQLFEGSIVFGNKYEVIFRGETLRITRVIEAGMYTDIKPVFIDNIRFVGQENLGFTDLSGEYAHYTGKIYINTWNDKIYFTDLNPVDIYLVNSFAGRIHISFDNGEGLFVDRSVEYATKLYEYADPPQCLAQHLFIPDFFEYEINKEIH